MAAEEPRVDSDPPSWAQSLIPWLVRADRAENVAGDLLEQYRETVLPERRRRRADAWYVRQVLGFLWRLTWPFVVLIAVQVVARAVADTLAPPDDYQFRSSLTTWGAINSYLVAGAYGAWRTRRVSTGALLAITSHTLAHAVAILFTIGFFATVISHNTDMLRLFQVTGGWGEVWGLPLMLMPVVAVLGLAGGFIGKLIVADTSVEKFFT